MTLDLVTTRDTPLNWKGSEPTVRELQDLLARLITDGTVTPDTPVRIVAEGCFSGFGSYRMQKVGIERRLSLVFNWDEG